MKSHFDAKIYRFIFIKFLSNMLNVESVKTELRSYVLRSWSDLVFRKLACMDR